MTYPESEYLDCITLAYQYDSSRDDIKKVLHQLINRGHNIPTLAWGKQRKLKIHGQSFRTALLREFSHPLYGSNVHS